MLITCKLTMEVLNASKKEFGVNDAMLND